MNIHSVGHGHGHPVLPLESTDTLIARQRSELPVTSESLPTNQPEKPAVDPTPVAAPDDEPLEGNDKLPGVLRNLQAGHFKGVADVRLRINFFEELSALASQQSSSTAQAEVGQLLTTVDEQVDQLVASLGIEDADKQDAVTELVTQFETTVQQAVTDFDGKAGESTASLKEVISLAFSALVEQLRELFVPALPAEPDDATDAADGADQVADGQDGSTRLPGATDLGADIGELGAASTSTTQAARGSLGDITASLPEDDLTIGDTVGTDPVAGDTNAPTGEAPAETGDSVSALFDAALETFVSTFNTALADFMGAIQTVSQLADPSPPSGNGRAYNKFLAIYDQLRGIESSDVDALG